MDSLLEIIKNRRSIREYKSTPLPPDAIDKLVEALRWAPSAGNLEARKFIFVTNKQKRSELAEAAGQDFVGRAPLVVVACADLKSISGRYGIRGEELYSICDVACSVQNMMLIAHEMGLGTAWVGSFDDEGVSCLLDLPEGLKPVALVPVGIPDEEPLAPTRVDLREVVDFIE